jgi:hypothetical protein
LILPYLCGTIIEEFKKKTKMKINIKAYFGKYPICLDTAKEKDLETLLHLVVSEDPDLLGVISSFVLRNQVLHKKKLADKLQQLRTISQYTAGMVAEGKDLKNPRIKEAISLMYQEALDSGALTNMTSENEKFLLETLEIKQ